MEKPDKNTNQRKDLIDFFAGLPDNELEALRKITEELLRARNVHLSWPRDAIHQAAIVQEESGELIRAALHHEFDDAPKEPMETEAIQTAAMALRFILNG